ncbi:MAG: CPBP family intramembrane metalloprotease [Bacteroidales bacterium]|nr:CPBP family intramembrane metalloprotease [Bacteroidales bacterium]
MKDLNIFFIDKKPFSQLVGLFFLFLFSFIISSGLMLLIPEVGSGDAAIRFQLVQQALSQLLNFLLPACLFALLFQPQGSNYFQFHWQGRHWGLAAVGMVIMLLVAPANDYITAWNDGWNLGPLESSMRRLSDLAKTQIEQMLSLSSIPDLLLQLFVVALLPAVCEELFFRGGVQQILHRWFGSPHAAIIVASLIFSLAHGDLYGLIPRFFLGLVLGYLFFYSGSMLVNVCAHFLNNAMVVLLCFLNHRGVLSFSPTDPLGMPWYVTLPCLLAALLLFLVYFIKNDAKRIR